MISEKKINRWVKIERWQGDRNQLIVQCEIMVEMIDNKTNIS